MELHAYVLGAFRLKEAHGTVAIEGDLGVGTIVADGYIVLLGEGNNPFEEVELSYCPCGVVGVVYPHQPGFLRHSGRDFLKVGQETVVLCERHEVALAAGEHGAYGVDRVARVGNERCISRLYEAEGDVPDALFGADEGQHLFIGVEVQFEAALVPLSHGLPELGQTLGLRGAGICRVSGCLAEALYDMGWGGDVGVSDAETDYIY